MKKALFTLGLCILFSVSLVSAQEGFRYVYPMAEDVMFYLPLDYPDVLDNKIPYSFGSSRVGDGAVLNVSGVHNTGIWFRQRVEEQDSYLRISGESYNNGEDVAIIASFIPLSEGGHIVNKLAQYSGITSGHKDNAGVALYMSRGELYCLNRGPFNNRKYIKWEEPLVLNSSWYHAVCIVEGSTGDPRLYVNNVSSNQEIVTDGELNTSIRSNMSPWMLGALGWGSYGEAKTGYVEAIIDEVFGIRRNLSDEEVSILFKDGSIITHEELLATESCVIEWYCSEYEVCVEPMENASCLNVSKHNLDCLGEYEGNYSEFELLVCEYSTPTSGGGGGGWPEETMTGVSGEEEEEVVVTGSGAPLLAIGGGDGEIDTLWLIVGIVAVVLIAGYFVMQNQQKKSGRKRR